MDFGTVVVWNASPEACRIGGRVAFTAYLSDGTRDLAAQNNQAVVLRFFVMRPGMVAPPEFSEIDNYLFFILAGVERDDPAQPDGVCRAADEVAPSRLVLTIGTLALETPNDDKGNPMRNPWIYGCHGKVLLESAHLPVAQ
jgi:hypothetical protein